MQDADDTYAAFREMLGQMTRWVAGLRLCQAPSPYSHTLYCGQEAMPDCAKCVQCALQEGFTTARDAARRKRRRTE